MIRAGRPARVAEEAPRHRENRRRGEVPQVKVRRAEQAVSLETERHLAGAGRSREELLSEVTGGLELASGEVNGREPVQRRKQTRRFAHPLAELASPCVDRLDLGRRVPPCRHDGRTEEHAQLELQLVALGARGLPFEHRQSAPQVLDRFGVRRAIHGALGGSLPRRNRLWDQARFAEMMAEQLGSLCADLGIPLLVHLCDPQVKLLPAAAEQRVIGRLVDQRVLENVAGLVTQALLEQELRFDQLSEPAA
jgi:hypothetical protein